LDGQPLGRFGGLERKMLDATKLLANALGEHLSTSYRRVFGSREPRYGEVIDEAARLTMERIGRSDALMRSDLFSRLKRNA
jgi:hypothetical protein